MVRLLDHSYHSLAVRIAAKRFAGSGGNLYTACDMYQLSIEQTFRATHAITIAGEAEQTHEHDWKVKLVVQGDKLDGDGLLVDFHLIEAQLTKVIEPFIGKDIGAVEPFTKINPTAELIAQHIAEQISVLLPSGVKIKCVSVTEAPNCVATYRPY